MEIKLFDSELKVMEVLWKEGETSASQLAKILKEEVGWNRNTTYTVIKKCIEKGAIERIDPNYRCKALVSKAYIQQEESKAFVNKMFGGSIEKFFAAFTGGKKLSEEEVEHLEQMVKEMK